MTKIVSLELVEDAFEEIFQSIDKVEKVMESQFEIERNEMKLAQEEKIRYMSEKIEFYEREKYYVPFYKLA